MSPRTGQVDISTDATQLGAGVVDEEGMNLDARPDAFVFLLGYRLEVWLVAGRTLLLAGMWAVPGGEA